MPREIVHINISTLPPYEAGAVLLSWLAYPAANDEPSRLGFWAALCRHWIIDFASHNPQWAWNYQPIKPGFFTINEQTSEKVYRAGFKRIHHRLVAGHRYVAPFLVEQHLQRKVSVGGFKTTVNNMTALASLDLDVSNDAENIKRRYFVPCKPVLHVAVAVKQLFQSLSGNDDQGKLGELLINSHNIEVAVRLAEDFRPMILRLKDIEIEDEQTIQFVLD
jgi:hypothetical protein